MLKRRTLLLTFLLALVIKSISVCYLSYVASCTNPVTKSGLIARNAGDTFSYLQPIENWLGSGNYFYKNEQGEKIFAGRMPHYGVFYLVFRVFLEKTAASDALILFQILMEVIAVVAACILVFKITRSKIAYISVLIILLLSLNVTQWTNFLLPESLGVSFLILFIYHYYYYLKERNVKSLVYSAVFLSLVVVLKPYYIFIYLFLFLDWVISNRRDLRKAARIAFGNTILFGGLLTLLLTPWVIRNYFIYQKIVPTQITIYAGINYSKAELAWRKYVIAFGGNIVHWDSNSAGCYFVKKNYIPCDYVLPEKAIPHGYTREDIEALRVDFLQLQKTYDADKDLEIEKRFLDLRDAIRKNSPVLYYFKSRLEMTKQFIFHSGSYYLHGTAKSGCYNYHFQMVIKLIQSFLYYATLILGTIGFLIYCFRERIILALALLFLMIIVIFPILLGGTEWRYFMYSYNLLAIGSALCIHAILLKMGILNPANRTI